MRSSVKLAAYLLLFLILAACRCWAEELMTIEQAIKDAHEGVEFVGNEYLVQRIQANPKLILLDVRSQEEYAAGHLKGAAWVERGVVEFKLARTLRDPDAEIIIYCKKGNRSGLAVKALKRMGYKNVKAHLGFDTWVAAGLPFFNFLGEAKMIKLQEMNAATAQVDYYVDKK